METGKARIWKVKQSKRFFEESLACFVMIPCKASSRSIEAFTLQCCGHLRKLHFILASVGDGSTKRKEQGLLLVISNALMNAVS